MREVPKYTTTISVKMAMKYTLGPGHNYQVINEATEAVSGLNNAASFCHLLILNFQVVCESWTKSGT